VPRWCFQNPVNLVDAMEEDVAPRRGNFASESIAIKFRSCNGSQVTDTKCTINTTNSVEEILTIYRGAFEKAAKATTVRLFFNGRELEAHDMAAACGLRKNDFCVLAYFPPE
jgi:hypothetical protein